MNAFDAAHEMGHEQVILVQDRAAGLVAVIAIHDTTLGRAVGGTRMRPYASVDAAVQDALRLSRAMTYKAALAGVPFGGGKAVILGDPGRDKSRALLVAYARALDQLSGRFHTGCDMGIDGRDVAVLARLTKHASHTPADSALQTAGLAALGVFASIRAVARRLERELLGFHVAVQGLGQLGYRLAELLTQSGARLTVADVDQGRAERAAASLGATIVPAEFILDVEADLFSPNAGGSVIDADAVARLRCRAVVGGANDQLADPGDGDALFERGILFAPDYVANAGGLLSLLFETGELDEAGVVARVEALGGEVDAILDRSERESIPPHRLADRIAEERLAAAREAR
jgi:leucine dehydrogenase